MSTSFEARFSTSRLTLPVLLARLEAALPDCGLRFFGSVAQLQPNAGWPTVGSLDFLTIDSILDAAAIASEWWGIGMELVSDVLLAGLGRSDAVEVNLNVFRAPDHRWTISYLESSTATDHRMHSDEAASNLYTLQMTLCDVGQFELSMYDEQNHNRKPVPSLRNLEVAVKRAADEPRHGDLSVIVSSKILNFDNARRLAGRRADEVKLSVNGYVLFPFLTPSQAKIKPA